MNSDAYKLYGIKEEAPTTTTASSSSTTTAGHVWSALGFALLWLGIIGIVVASIVLGVIYGTSSSSSPSTSSPHSSSSSSSSTASLGAALFSSSSSSSVPRTGQLNSVGTFTTATQPPVSIAAVPNLPTVYALMASPATLQQWTINIPAYTATLVNTTTTPTVANCLPTFVSVSSTASYLYVGYSGGPTCAAVVYVYPMSSGVISASPVLAYTTTANTTSAVQVADAGTTSTLLTNAASINESYVFFYGAPDLSSSDFSSVGDLPGSQCLSVAYYLTNDVFLLCDSTNVGTGLHAPGVTQFTIGYNNATGGVPLVDASYQQLLVDSVNAYLYVVGPSELLRFSLVNNAINVSSNVSLISPGVTWGCATSVLTSDGFIYIAVNGDVILQFQGITPLNPSSIDMSPGLTTNAICEFVLVQNSVLVLASSDRTTLQIFKIS